VRRPNARFVPQLLALAWTIGCGDDGAEMDEHSDEASRALPEVAYCDPARDGSDARAELERRVLERVEAHRRAGADCGAYGKFRPADPLREDGGLRCAARVHSLDMATRNFMAHENPDGERPADRVAEAGSRFATVSEAIAVGDIAADRVVDEIWIGSPGSCAALMGDTFRFVGVGVFEGANEDEAGQAGRWWTVVLAH
jgi:uncharacterized protein YkwD